MMPVSGRRPWGWRQGALSKDLSLERRQARPASHLVAVSGNRVLLRSRLRLRTRRRRGNLVRLSSRLRRRLRLHRRVRSVRSARLISGGLVGRLIACPCPGNGLGEARHQLRLQAGLAQASLFKLDLDL
jgi:hypothetical protein